MLTKEIVIRKGNVYLIEYGYQIRQVVIHEVTPKYIHHTLGWDTVQDFLDSNPQLYGRTVPFLFFFKRIIRDNHNSEVYDKSSK